MRDIAPDNTPRTSARPTVSRGELIADRYRLVDRLARGGMAEVWEAVDEVLTRPVAVKLLLPHLVDDEAFVARFRREAIAAARLSDPHIVSIYDTCSEGVEAIVMELIRGSTLRQLIDERGQLGVGQAVEVAVQVAAALDHAHGNGLVHRDVKPGNILLSEDGRVLVTDFGIAKAATEAADLTEVGQVVGTAKYLSPEQVRGAKVDARSDVYALGVVLYEMLCGQPPFNGDSSTAIAVARLTSDPEPLGTRCDGVPPTLEAVVRTAMARDPDDRYQSAAELARALRRVDPARVGTAAPPGGLGVDLTQSLGGLPAVDDRDPTPVPPPDPRFTRRERSWLVPAVLILVVAGTLGIVGALLNGIEPGGGGDGDGGPTTVDDRDAPPVEVDLGAVRPEAFDPAGEGRENDRRLPGLVDGDPATSWRTERYNDADLAGGRFKPGVGVVLHLDGTRSLEQLELASPTRGWAAEVYVGDGSAGQLEGWGAPVAAAEAIPGDAVFDLGGAEGEAVLVWITHLGDGSVGDRYRTEISGVTLRARP